jgi:hypothetical protein
MFDDFFGSNVTPPTSMNAIIGDPWAAVQTATELPSSTNTGSFAGEGIQESDPLDVLIAAQSADTDTTIDIPIVVVGKRLMDSAPTSAGSGSGDFYFRDGYMYNVQEALPITGESSEFSDASLPTDEAVIEISVNIYRDLTPTEQQAIDALQGSIGRITFAIHQLADNSIVTLPNGAHVTGGELKAIWSKIDFVVNADSFEYSNGTNRGQADPNYGNASVSINIGTLISYNELFGGMNYLVAHELAHISQANTTFFSDERTANDIARALLAGAAILYLPDPTFSYSLGAPLSFSTSSSDSGGSGDTGGGTGGGTGWSNDEPL